MADNETVPEHWRRVHEAAQALGLALDLARSAEFSQSAYRYSAYRYLLAAESLPLEQAVGAIMGAALRATQPGRAAGRFEAAAILRDVADRLEAI